MAAGVAVLLAAAVAVASCDGRGPAPPDAPVQDSAGPAAEQGSVCQEEQGAGGNEGASGGPGAKSGKEEDAGEEGGGGEASDTRGDTGAVQNENAQGENAQSEAAQCPLVIAHARETSRRQRGLGCGWAYRSTDAVEDAAAQVLGQLGARGWDLVFSGDLDLFGQAWGCVARLPEERRTVLVYMVPEVIGSERGEDNQLAVSVVAFGGGS